MTTSTDSTSLRRVLDRVPAVGFYREAIARGGKPWPEDIIFPSCMRALMEYLGHPEFDYVHFIGVTGAASFLNWKDGWHPDNSALYYMAPFNEHVKMFDHAFASTGYAYELIQLKGKNAVGIEDAKRHIIDSIDRGVPIVAHGVVGPPEPSIICGYDDAGDTLIGYSFFQGMPHFAKDVEILPTGMFRTRNWFDKTFDLFITHERGAVPDPRSTRREALRWMVHTSRTPITWDDRHNGLAAYDAWARHLAIDPLPETGTVTGDSPFGVHDCAVGMVAECRWYGARYLARVAGEEPKMAARLYEAAACYAREHDLMWQVWACAGGNGRSPEHAARFADPAARRKMIDLIHEARRQDERAIEHLEAALASIEA